MTAQPRTDTQPRAAINASELRPRPPAALYIRVSSEKQAGNYSPETQEADCRAYAAAKGYAVDPTHVYYETHTATDLWERPELTRAREALARGEVGALICHHVDRFSRKQVHAAILADECERAGAALLFALSEFEDSATGDFLRNAKAFAAELELEKLKERTMRGMRARVQSGKLTGRGRPPYGYRYADATRAALVEDPATSWVVRRVFADLARGLPLRAICLALTAEGVPTPTGKLATWWHTTLRQIVTNPAYMGQATAWRYRRTRNRQRGTSGKVLRPVEEQIPLPAGTVPALVDAATFAAVQEQLGLNKRHAARNNRNPEASLLRNGFLRCGVCDHAMVATSRSDGTIQYRCCRQALAGERCNHGRRAHLLDAEVWAGIARRIKDRDFIRRQLAAHRRRDTAAEELASVDEGLAALAKKHKGLMLVAGAIENEDAAAGVAAQLTDLAQQRRALEERRAAVLERREEWRDTQQMFEDLEAACAVWRENLDDADYALKRRIITALDLRVLLYPGHPRPRYDVYTDWGATLRGEEPQRLIVDTVSRCSSSRPRRARPSRCTRTTPSSRTRGRA
jgi:site-specific DNA recombinase